MTSESTFRLVALANVALILPFGLFFRIRSQMSGESLARRNEGLIVMIGLRLRGLLAWMVLIAYLLNLSWVSWCAISIPDWLRWVGAFLGLFVVPPFWFWTFRTLGKNLTDTVVTRREHPLVTNGPYRWVRHPFYIVVLLFGLSLFLEIANWGIALMEIVVLGFLIYRTRVEELKLLERFGEEYRAYTPRGLF